MTKDEFLKLTGNFKNIVFDYGGILIDLDYDIAVRNLTRLSERSDASNIYSKSKQLPFFSSYEKGNINCDEFLSKLMSHLDIPAKKKEETKEAWNSMILDLHQERVNFIRELRKSKRLFILSNINQLHEDYVDSYLEKNESVKDFYSLFEKVYFSHHLGFRKPEPEIFEYILNDSQLKKEETFFIDDSPQHVEGARSVGLTAYHLERPNTLFFSKA